MPSETRTRTRTGFRPLWLLLFLAPAQPGTATEAAGDSRSGHHVASLPALCPRASLGLGDPVAQVDTAVCLTSSLFVSSASSASTSSATSTARLSSSRTCRQPTKQTDDQEVGRRQNRQDGQIHVGLGRDSDTTRQAGSPLPAPWVKGSCRRGSVPTKGRQKDTRDGIERAKYCAYTHPTFNQGMGLSVIATARRLDAMAVRPIFEGGEEDVARKGHAHISADWPPDNASDPLAAVIAWREQSIPGKDVGLVAARPIRRGERIMARTPAVMIDGAAVDALPVAAFAGLLHDAAASLPGPHRAQFFNLSTNYGSDGADANENEAYQIFATNAFRTGIADGEPDLHSVFRDVSRINHGCQPNCAYFFDPATLAHNVYAVVDIMQGEELTVGYIDPIQTYAERQAKLHRHWGFGCTCARCAQPPHRVAESDDRVRSIQALLTSLDDYSIPGTNSTVGPPAGELLVLLFELEGLHARMHEAEYRLALEWNGIGDALRATQAARRCLDRGLLVRGAEQAFLSSMRALAADPAAHWSWKFRLGKAKNEEEEKEERNVNEKETGKETQ